MQIVSENRVLLRILGPGEGVVDRRVELHDGGDQIEENEMGEGCSA